MHACMRAHRAASMPWRAASIRIMRRYDAWVDDPRQYALAGANGRFSIPALARGLATTLGQVGGAAARALEPHVQQWAPKPAGAAAAPAPAAAGATSGTAGR